ncbi:MAG: hypothetical protein IKV89_01070 [Clostridia bacterium]|nr:hypothetical protein [Clostridia bacterium]
MKRLMSVALLVVLLLSANITCSAYFEMVTLYAPDGREIQVVETNEDRSVVKSWVASGWYEGVNVYSPNGRTITVSPFAVQQWTDVGWYTSPIIAMYAADGRQILVGRDEVDAYKAVGWYTSPNVTLYASDGRTISVPLTEKQAYMNVGWHDSPIVTMYSLDGRTIAVYESEVESYSRVGWYTQPVVKMYSLGKSIVVYKSEVDAYRAAGWYDAPLKILHSYDDRVIFVSETEAEAYKQVGWQDKDASKALYQLNTASGLKGFIKTFYPTVVTATGRYPFDVTIMEYDSYLWVQLEYDYKMVSDATSSINMGVEQRVQAKKDIRHFMNVLANDIMSRTDVPIEIQFYRGGYEYPTLKIGYNATRFLTAKNFKDEYVVASDGSYMRVRNMTGFYWDTSIDDYDF